MKSLKELKKYQISKERSKRISGGCQQACYEGCYFTTDHSLNGIPWLEDFEGCLGICDGFCA